MSTDLQAGREMDALVAENVMEWHENAYHYWVDKQGKPVDLFVVADSAEDHEGNRAFRPSTDIAAALVVLEKLRERWGRIYLGWEEDDSVHGEGWKVDVNPDYDGHLAVQASPTLPLAICRAALEEFGVDA